MSELEPAGEPKSYSEILIDRMIMERGAVIASYLDNAESQHFNEAINEAFDRYVAETISTLNTDELFSVITEAPNGTYIGGCGEHIGEHLKSDRDTAGLTLLRAIASSAITERIHETYFLD